MPINPVDLKIVQGANENVYEAINVLGKRARHINDEVRAELHDKLSLFSELVESDEEQEVNHEQARISIEYELRDKPTIQSIKEKSKNDMEFHYAQ
ncbi:MAG: DNA-directed RNA polymerase subunit omega [Bacteroidetes bacterium]|nr:DNA-directed RNA polymerase subunit omega [Bacteroidota bacterium]MCA0446867.1 DNA-directed RNA polymerase subunit omega [Bacteroidota bacterium]